MTKVDEIMELFEAFMWSAGADEQSAKAELEKSIESLAKDAERFNFLCDCENEQALDLLAERVGQRGELIELADELIKEAS